MLPVSWGTEVYLRDQTKCLIETMDRLTLDFGSMIGGFAVKHGAERQFLIVQKAFRFGNKRDESGIRLDSASKFWLYCRD